MGSIGTTYKQLEPVGFGYSSFGDDDNTSNETRIHSRGFGDPKTIYTTYEDNN